MIVTKVRLPAFFCTVMLLLLTGCAIVPKGPSVAVMPGADKDLDEFATDDNTCRSYASKSIGMNVNETGANNIVTGAVVGTAVGAAAGALIGGHRGASVGAGAGLLMGSAVGVGNAETVEHDTQRRYNIAYEQCMYSKGNQVRRASTRTTYYRYRHPPGSVPQDRPEE